MKTFEDEAMAEITPPALARVTGSTGINPVQDGITRAGWVAAIQAVIAFTVVRWEWLTAEELALLQIPIVFFAVVLWALFDKVLRGRILSS